MTPDIANAAFEFLGGCMLWASVWALVKDKEVRGVRWWSFAFFAVWGLWNLFYYPHLDQWWSFAGGIFIVSANIVWVGLAIYYGRNNHVKED